MSDQAAIELNGIKPSIESLLFVSDGPVSIDDLARALDTERERVEAALKALRLGLTIDTRRIHCAIDPRRYSDHDWLEFNIACGPSYSETLRGWWRAWGDYALTVAIAA